MQFHTIGISSDLSRRSTDGPRQGFRLLVSTSHVNGNYGTYNDKEVTLGLKTASGFVEFYKDRIT